MTLHVVKANIRQKMGQFLKEAGLISNSTDLQKLAIEMGHISRVSSKMINIMEKVWKFRLMVLGLKGVIGKARSRKERWN